MKKALFVSMTMILSVIFFLVVVSPCRAADEESLARQAEHAGRLQQALTHYINALQSTSQGSAKDLELRRSIIKLGQRMHPRPAVSEEVYRYMARGEAFAELAGDKEGFLRAEREFQKAAGKAPWLADAYYSLGMVQDKAGFYGKAIRSLKLYLLAAPDARNAREVRMLIYKIEVRQEEAERTKREKGKAVAEKKTPQPPTIHDLTGHWKMKGSSMSANATIQDGMLAFDSFESTSSGGKHPLIKFSLKGYTLSGRLLKMGLRRTGKAQGIPSYSCLEKFRKQGGFKERYVQIKGAVSKGLNTIQFRYRDRAHLPGCHLGYADFEVEYYR